MKKQSFLLLILTFVLCYCTSENSSVSQGEPQKEDASLVPPQGPPPPPISVSEAEVKQKESWEASAYNKLGCCNEFYADEKKADCCCDEVLKNYAAWYKGKTSKEILHFKRKNQQLRKCSGQKEFAKKLDLIEHPESEEQKDDGSI